MSEATVFSQVQRITFDSPVTKAQAEELLKKFLVTIGEPLAYNKIILGHIKMLAKATSENDFLFLSLTRLDQVDVKPSPIWANDNFTTVEGLELTINVLVFGYNKALVTKAVTAASREILPTHSQVKLKLKKTVLKFHMGKGKLVE